MFRISHYNVIKNPVFEFCLKLFEKNPTLLGNKNTAFDHVSSGVCGIKTVRYYNVESSHIYM